MLATLKKLQVVYLQAKINHEVVGEIWTFKKLQAAEEALINFGMSIITEETDNISKKGRKKILDLLCTF